MIVLLAGCYTVFQHHEMGLGFESLLWQEDKAPGKHWNARMGMIYVLEKGNIQPICHSGLAWREYSTRPGLGGWQPLCSTIYHPPVLLYNVTLKTKLIGGLDSGSRGTSGEKPCANRVA